MPRLFPVDQKTIDSYELSERGVRDGSSPSELFDPVTGVATRKVFCQWEARFEVVRFFLGDVSSYNDGATKLLSRLLPQRHPILSEWIAVKLAEPIKGFKWKDYGVPVKEEDPEDPDSETKTYPWDGRVNAFWKAELTFQYEHVNYTIKSDDVTSIEEERYVTYQPGEGSFVDLTQPGCTMKYQVPGATGNNKPVPQGVPVPYGVPYSIPEETFSLLWRRLPEDAFEPDSPLYNRIYTGTPLTPGGPNVPFLGAVNSAVFWGRPKATCRLVRVAPKLLRSPTGIGWEWEILYTFLYRPQGQLNLRWFPVNSQDAATAGVYQVSNNANYVDPEVMPDYSSLASVRDFTLLFSIG